MSANAPDLMGRPSASFNENLLRLLLLTALLAVCGPLCLVASALILRECRARHEPRTWLICAITGALGGVFVVVLAAQFGALLGELKGGVVAMLNKSDPNQGFASIGRPLSALWALSLPLAPLG